MNDNDHSHMSAWSNPDTMLRILRELRDDRKYCDIVFVGDNGREFYCHKIILAIFTDVFNASCDFKIQNNDEGKITRIMLEDLDVRELIFEKILDIIYGKKPQILLDDAIDLLFDADKLLMNNVRSYAEDLIVDNNYLKETQQSLIRICNFPGLRKCQKLLTNVKTHLCSNFAVISEQPEFFKISVEDLCALDILKNCDLFQSSETCINFIGKWITYDVDNRIVDIKVMIEHLNGSIDHDMLDEFLSAIINMRKNTDSNGIISLLRFILPGILLKSIYLSSKFTNSGCSSCTRRNPFHDGAGDGYCNSCGRQRPQQRAYPQYLDWFNLDRNKSK